MAKHNQDGAVNVLLIPLIVATLLLIAAAVFGVWANGQRQDYKNNVDQKISLAVAAAIKQEDIAEQQKYDQAAKLPLTSYKGPEAYGSIIVKYPKTWSSYVDASGNGNNDANVDGYFYPGTVPSTDNADSDSGGTNFALRIQVLSDSYSDTLSNFQQQDPAPSIKPYSLPKVPSVVGVRVSGQIQDNKTGDMIVLPLRSETLEVWTEGTQFESDFNNNILPNFTFSP